VTRFSEPWAFALLLLVIPLILVWVRQARRPPSVLHADVSLFGEAPRTWRVRLRHLPRALRIAFLVLAALAIAGPQAGLRNERISSRGVDIVTILDRSSSMRAMDLKPDRLSVARETIRSFVQGRRADRVGLVVFAGNAYTACPLTLDRGAIERILDTVEIATRTDDGTAIGLGLASAVGRLKDSDATSRVAVLVTDGVNNAGEIAPLTAADLAAELGVKVYTIGVGVDGEAPIRVRDSRGRWITTTMRVQIDEETLRQIADVTGGRYYRAQDEASLRAIFDEIDALEKSEVESEIYVDWSDRFEGLLLTAGLVFLAEIFFARWLVGRMP
jgi:Ca-activated chloride channel family protein